MTTDVTKSLNERTNGNRVLEETGEPRVIAFGADVVGRSSLFWLRTGENTTTSSCMAESFMSNLSSAVDLVEMYSIYA